MKFKTLSSSETAYFLRYKLGNVRAWDDLLADMRRGKSAYLGEMLLPVGKIRSSRHTRPVYLFTEVCEFVEKVSCLYPQPTKPHILSLLEVEIDLADKRHWSVRPPLVAR